MRIHIIAAALLAGTAPALPAQAAQGPPGISASVPDGIFSGTRSRAVLMAQVLLDRSRHSPGVIDGYPGGNTARAIRAYQRTNGLDVSGKVDASLLRHLAQRQGGDVLQRYTLSEADVSGPFVHVPDGFAAMAKLERVGYESAAEKIAEKFHMSQGFLRALNPSVDFSKAGTGIVVAAVPGEPLGKDVARIEVDKTNNAVRAYDGAGTMVASYPATVGSSTFPSPSGSMTVRAVAPDATYHFDPEGREWGPDERLTIAAGPNNPVGGVWIDLSKDGYGIHGSPDPMLIGKTASHGCVRLTNWDAKALAAAVGQGVKVEFV